MFNSQFQAIVPQPFYGVSPLDYYGAMAQQARQQILMGLQTQYASTGYPIDFLRGSAHTVALLAAIGGGAVSAGGNGVYGGLQVLIQYVWAMGAAYGYQQGYNAQQ